MLKRCITMHRPQVPARLGPRLSTLAENSVSHSGTQLVLHAEELHHNASAGNKARVTSMATMYSTTRPVMPCKLLPALCSLHTPPPPSLLQSKVLCRSGLVSASVCGDWDSCGVHPARIELANLRRFGLTS